MNCIMYMYYTNIYAIFYNSSHFFSLNLLKPACINTHTLMHPTPPHLHPLPQNYPGNVNVIFIFFKVKFMLKMVYMFKSKL